MPSVLTIGDINADVIALLDRYPRKGGDELARHAELHIGGSAANTALVLARFGIDVAFLGRTGDDFIARYVLQRLTEAGIDTSLIQHDPDEMTGLMFIVVTPDGERTILGYRGANARLAPVSFEEATLSGLNWVHVSGYTLLEDVPRKAVFAIVEEASRLGVTVSLDVGVCTAHQARRHVDEMLRYVDVLLPSLEETRALTDREDPEEALSAFLEKGIKVVAIKLGKEGCLVGDGRKAFRVPALPVEVVDTTGAGDAFDAGFILGQMWGLGLRESALLANALGALACAVMGAGEGHITPHRAQKLLRQAAASPGWEDWRSAIERLSEVILSKEDHRWLTWSGKNASKAYVSSPSKSSSASRSP